MKLSLSALTFVTLLVHPATSFDRSFLRPATKPEPALNDDEDRELQTRIVGGRPSVQGAFPAYAIPTGNGLCGAVLIHEDILISAAHCEGTFDRFFAFNSNVYLGANSVDGRDALEKIRVVSERPHPSYNVNTDAYDMMLIQLRSPSKATPVPLNTDDSTPYNDEKLTIIGFGTTKSGGAVSSKLLQANVNAVDFGTCSRNYEYLGQIDNDSMICAAAPNTDSCQGDSGGPLFDENGKLVGIVSWGDGCAVRDKPGIYARISTSMDFIQQGICELSANPPDKCDNSSSIGSVDPEPPKNDVLPVDPSDTEASVATSPVASPSKPTLENQTVSQPFESFWSLLSSIWSKWFK